MTEKKPDEAAIFDVARRITDPNARADYVAQICGNETALKARVDALLEALDEDLSFMSFAPSCLGETVDQHGDEPRDQDEKLGTMIDNFKLMEQIGEGGFGYVYVAEQERPVRRKVALKLIKPGMDTKEVIARFEAERQALALMDHPNIAKVLDAGATESGRPYFVMELVRGIPITDYCNKKRLGTQQRLDLFISVCQAMQHAHQKGVIHRDVKPSNVLITEHDGKPVPKVIDFGVAKAIHQRLTEHTIYTRHQQIVGTPLYMSPEQAELSAFDVDTRTDIYSLGVLLYELLTGTTPIDRKRLREAAYDEIRRIIREEDPPKPSTRVSTMGQDTDSELVASATSDFKRLGSVLRGDLDWIIMKSLEKDRSRRYESASAFADDIKRHLENEPVLASPPSVTYRLRKFVRRRKGVVLATTAIVASMIIGLSATVYKSVEANKQRELAEEQKQLADEQRQRANEEAENARFSEAIAIGERKNAEEQQRLAEQQTAVAESENAKSKEVLSLMRDMLQSSNAWTRTHTGRSLPTSGQISEYTVRQMLDDFSSALLKDGIEDPAVASEIWDAIGWAYQGRDQWKATEAYRKSIEFGKQAFEPGSRQFYGYLHRSAYTILFGANFEHSILNAIEAESLLEEALACAKQVSDAEESVRLQHLARIQLGQCYDRQGRREEALRILNDLLHENPDDAWVNVALAWCLLGTDESPAKVIQHAEKTMQLMELNRLDFKYMFAVQAKGIVLLQQKRVAAADECFASLLKAHVDGYPKTDLNVIKLNTVEQRSRTLVALGKPDEALRILEGTLLTARQRGRKYEEARILNSLADLCVAEGQFDQAEKHLQGASQVIWEKFGPNDILFAKQQRALARLYHFTGRQSDADKIYRLMLQTIRTGIEQTNRNRLWLSELAWAYSHMTDASNVELKEATVAATEALELALPPEKNSLQSSLALALERLGQIEQAEDVLRKGLERRVLFCVSEWLPLEGQLIGLFESKGDWVALEVAMRDGIAHREVYLSPQHPMTLETKAKLTSWLIDHDRAADAEVLLEDCERLATHNRSTDERKTLAVKILVKAFDALGQVEKANYWRER